jgi:hypothetical protein
VVRDESESNDLRKELQLGLISDGMREAPPEACEAAALELGDADCADAREAKREIKTQAFMIMSGRVYCRRRRRIYDW